MCVFMYVHHKCVRCDACTPIWLSTSDLQESSDSSNTTVEDEDVKGKTAKIKQ